MWVKIYSITRVSKFYWFKLEQEFSRIIKSPLIELKKKVKKIMFIIFKHFSIKTENEFTCYLKAFKTLEKETKI